MLYTLYDASSCTTIQPQQDSILFTYWAQFALHIATFMTSLLGAASELIPRGLACGTTIGHGPLGRKGLEQRHRSMRRAALAIALLRPGRKLVPHPKPACA